MTKLFSNTKKGQVNLGNASQLIIVLVVIGIILGLGGEILVKFKDNLGTAKENETAANATQSALEGIDTFASFQTVIAIVLVAALILGLITLIRLS